MEVASARAGRACRAARAPDRLRQFADTLERIHFSAPPELRLDVRGDARDLASFGVRVLLSTPGADTPWGTVSRGRFSCPALPGHDQRPVQRRAEPGSRRGANPLGHDGELAAHRPPGLVREPDEPGQWRPDSVRRARRDRMGQARPTCSSPLHGAAMEGQTNLINADLALWAGQRRDQVGQRHQRPVHRPMDPRPDQRHSAGRRRQASLQPGEHRLGRRPGASAQRAPCHASGRRTASRGRILGLVGQARTVCAGLGRPGAAACSRAGSRWRTSPAAGSWRAPELTITNLHAELYQRHLDVRAGLDVATRALNLSLASDVDPHKVAPALTEGARRWLAPFAWEQPPELKGEVSLVLPAWTNRQPDWRAEVQPTLRLQGEFKLEHGGAYRGRAGYRRPIAHLLFEPGLAPAGLDGHAARRTARSRAEEDDRTRDFYFRISQHAGRAGLAPAAGAGAAKRARLLHLHRAAGAWTSRFGGAGTSRSGPASRGGWR